MGYSTDKLTLGLLADKKIIEDFVTVFKKLRSFNKYNNAHIGFLNMCISLLRPKTGYLFQHSEFAVKVGLSGEIEEWQAKCIDTRNRLIKVVEPIQHEKDSKGEDFQMGRDPKEAIADILAVPNPVEYITELLGIMLNDVDTYSTGFRKTVFFRDILLIALLIGNPLRIRMFSIMKLERNLIRKNDGSWWINFKREDFKNRKSLPSDYEVQVAPELVPLIERYLEEFRPLLFGAENSDYVFLKEFDPETKKHTGKKKETLVYKVESITKDIYNFSPQFLSQRISIRVKRYLPLSPGFQSHAFRHIVATSIIKTNPEMGFFLASKVLHDKLETVEDNYAHLKTHEFFQPYNKFLSGFLSRVINTDGGGKPFSENGGGGK
jgi:integrase